jgi:hypothetical protein
MRADKREAAATAACRDEIIEFLSNSDANAHSPPGIGHAAR